MQHSAVFAWTKLCSGKNGTLSRIFKATTSRSNSWNSELDYRDFLLQLNVLTLDSLCHRSSPCSKFIDNRSGLFEVKVKGVELFQFESGFTCARHAFDIFIFTLIIILIHI